MSVDPEASQSRNEPEDCREWEYHVSSTAAIGSLAIGVAYPETGDLYICLAEVVDPGVGVYAQPVTEIDKSTGKLSQRYRPAQWDEFVAALGRGEMSSKLIKKPE